MQKNVFHSVYFIRNNVMEKMQFQSPMSHLAHNSAHSAVAPNPFTIQLYTSISKIYLDPHELWVGMGIKSVTPSLIMARSVC